VSRARTAWRAAALAALLGACAPGARAEVPGLIIEAELTPARVYVGGEARLRLRLLRAPGAAHGVLLAPALGDAADVSPLGTILVYQTLRGGAFYVAHERRFAIVPRRAGRLVVPGAEFESTPKFVDVPGQDDGRPPPTAHGPQRVLEVRPVPAGAAEPWLPARSLTLEESWSRDPNAALAAGLPVTRTLVLRAEGLAAERLPRLRMPRTPALLVRYDRPELSTAYRAEGMIGRSVQRIVLVPVRDADVTLPPVSVRWWDVAADAPRSATLAGRTLRLHPAPVADAPLETPAPMSARAVMRWFAVAILLLSAVFLAWHLRRQSTRDLRDQLREACRRNDPRTARAALTEWWKLTRKDAPVPLVQRMGADWDPPAREQLAALDAALYAERAWDGKAFWREVRPWLRAKPPRRGAAPPPSLPPLFRLQAGAAPARRHVDTVEEKSPSR
jgi:hypothetical protein